MSNYLTVKELPEKGLGRVAIETPEFVEAVNASKTGDWFVLREYQEGKAGKRNAHALRLRASKRNPSWSCEVRGSTVYVRAAQPATPAKRKR